MTKQIESEKLLIKQIFERWYKIPNYQRPYVWGKDQISDLLDDISFARNQNDKAEYFLGSTVFQTKKDSDGEYAEDDVLDGQQRLTTLFLITATIRDLTCNQNLKDTCSKIIYQNANEFDGTPERIRIIFDIRDEVKRFVDTFIKIENGTSDNSKLIAEKNRTDDLSIKNMVNAIIEIKSYFSSEENQISVEDFFKFLNNKVILIYVASESLEDAFRMFTILNNRGVKLRNSDILKAENLRNISKTNQKTYAKYWEEIENYFNEDFDVFLSHIRTVLVKEKARLNLYDEYEKNVYNPQKYLQDEKKYITLPPLLEKGEKTIDFLTDYKNHYDDIFNKEHFHTFGDYKFDNLIAIMQNVLPADFWIPPLLSFYNKFGTNSLLEFTEKLDNKFSYDWIVGYTPTTRIENMTNIIKVIDETNQSDINKVLNGETFKINVPNLISTLSEDIYGRRFARYILYKLDYFYGNTDKINVPKIISVEHILPQNPKSESQWVTDFSEEERLSLTNKIGNLVLISRRKNSSQGRLDYDKKQEKYFKNNIELFRNSVRIFQNQREWKPINLKDNNSIVLDRIEKHYKLNE